jgi:hypothetical protein
VLAILSTRVDRSFLTGRLHHEGGVIYFVIALVAIFLLLWVARYGEQMRKPTQEKASTTIQATGIRS